MTPTSTNSPYRDDSETRMRFKALEEGLAAASERIAGVSERLRRAEAARGHSRAQTTFVAAWSLVVLAGLGVGVRWCFVGSAWGEHARRLAEREAVAYTRATLPSGRAVSATCSDGPGVGEGQLCIVLVDGVRVRDLVCDDDEPSYNDGCAVRTSERGVQ